MDNRHVHTENLKRMRLTADQLEMQLRLQRVPTGCQKSDIRNKRPVRVRIDKINENVKPSPNKPH
ncbi:hypothetical protein MOC98_13775 [Bacillus spizizenii]|uniref:Uncharacterized protein n=1 Tax=Bacillus spizizenii TaxID=96241 RepID=A0A9Q4E7U2_BACSC|nr:hypothetical protein [Bacillus spizizenii]MCY8459087.1 hypothetical protein [Bacillus spizizenii]